MRCALIIVALVFANRAFADLYRWVDPETGSIRYSNYPPAWYGDPLRERLAPAVTHIPAPVAPRAAPTAPAPAERPPDQLTALQKRFVEFVKTLTGISGPDDFKRAGSGFRQHVESYEAVRAELDRIDPGGAERRRREAEPLLDRLKAGLRAQFSPAATDSRSR